MCASPFGTMTARSGPEADLIPQGMLPGVSSPMRTLISNGTIVTTEGSSVADVLVDGETIALIGADLAGTGITADETIDASGKYVIPGAIDVHTHMELPFGGTFAKDTFETGTRAAAFGGTTTIVDFAVQSRGKSLREGLDAWHAKAEGMAVADYGFHMIMSDVNDDTLKEMDQLVAEGVPDFKLFTAYPGVFYSDDGAIFRAMQQTARNGGLIMMHAENGLAIDVIAADTFESGVTDPIGHGLARYSVLEGEATNRVIRLAQAAGVPVYIVHLSAKEALDEVRRARDEGLPAFAETCPQYLFLSLDDLGNGFNGAKFVCSPPLRAEEHHPELWTGLVKDDLQLVSTDHCPFDFEGQKELGRGDFRKVPNGLPGVEDRVDLMHDGGVVGGRFTRERWVELISTAPAKLFGMYPRKGSISVGADADLVIYDPNRRRTISATTHHMDVDYSVYEGREVQGASDVVLSRGSVIVRDGTFTGKKGAGRFIKRSTADFARLA
jgi:dihydropyrimidinase